MILKADREHSIFVRRNSHVLIREVGPPENRVISSSPENNNKTLHTVLRLLKSDVVLYFKI